MRRVFLDSSLLTQVRTAGVILLATATPNPPTALIESYLHCSMMTVLRAGIQLLLDVARAVPKYAEAKLKCLVELVCIEVSATRSRGHVKVSECGVHCHI